MSSLFWLELGLVAGLVGVAGASLTLCSCCRRGGTSLSSLLSVRTCFPAQMHACGQQCRSTVTYSCPCSFSIWRRACTQVQPRLAQGGLGAECGMQRSIRRPRKPELDWLPVGDAVAGAPECGAVGWDCCGAAVHSVHAALRDVGQGRCILSSPAYDVRARGMSSASIVWKLVKTWHGPYVPSSKLTEGMRASPRRSLHAVQIESRHRLLNTWTHGTDVRLCCSLHRDLPSMYA